MKLLSFHYCYVNDISYVLNVNSSLTKAHDWPTEGADQDMEDSAGNANKLKS